MVNLANSGDQMMRLHRYGLTVLKAVFAAVLVAQPIAAPLRSSMIRSLPLALALAVLQACAQSVTVAPDYSIKEIPYAGAPIVWMDNESVLFTGNQRTSESQVSREATGGPIGLQRWNTRTQSVVELMRLGPYPDLCYDRGHIYVSFDRDSEHRVVRQGPLGKEEEFVGRRPNWAPFKGELNRFTCRWEELPKPTKPHHGVIAVLRDDHGFVEAERPSEPFPHRKYFLIRPNGERVVTEFRGGAGGAQLSEFAQGYVFQDGGGLFSRTVVRHIQVLHTDGRVRTHKLPAGPWMLGTVYGMPVRRGVLMVSLSEAGGVYIVHGERAERIVAGYVNNFAISPDGCRVAVNIRPANGVVSRMAVLNICKGEN